MKFIRTADSKGNPFELHLLRVCRWGQGPEFALRTSEKKVRNYQIGPGVKQNVQEDDQQNAPPADASAGSWGGHGTGSDGNSIAWT